MAHDVPLGCAPDEYDDLISGTCSHLPKQRIYYPVRTIHAVAHLKISTIYFITYNLLECFIELHTSAANINLSPAINSFAI
ncbi:hypothetical protein JSU12_04220 [Escherichia coli O126:H45]|uniref:hypothetical protein n=1 Tax=Escherichia coli TaxID=562 RepID=UPI001AAE57E6|nr:hypothetical protein [Escherichia coli]QTF37070.1 hypothetical protein JSU12_04220 [Escherichia coli O126:H45]